MTGDIMIRQRIFLYDYRNEKTKKLLLPYTDHNRRVRWSLPPFVIREQKIHSERRKRISIIYYQALSCSLNRMLVVMMISGASMLMKRRVVSRLRSTYRRTPHSGLGCLVETNPGTLTSGAPSSSWIYAEVLCGFLLFNN